MNFVSLIIPFLNEGEYLKQTLISVRQTNKFPVEVILVDDCSTDGYDYEYLSKQYSCRYIRNDIRLGVAASRNKGISIASHSHIMLLDAHMRIYTLEWDHIVSTLIERERTAIFCAKSYPLDDKFEKTQQPAGCGAWINLNEYCGESLLEHRWIYNQKNDTQVPCIMGAAYFFHRDYFLKIGGLNGLISWGFDEQLISIKSFLAGGKCVFTPQIETGHVYRSNFPYDVDNKQVDYNKLFIIYTLFPLHIIEAYTKTMENSMPGYFSALEMLNENIDSIKNIRSTLSKSINRNAMDYFIEYNKKFSELVT